MSAPILSFSHRYHPGVTMDRTTSSDAEHISAPNPDKPVFTSSGGGIFAGSQNFVVFGGTFADLTNNYANLTNNYVAAPVVPPDFRMMPMGDIDLQQELTVNRTFGVVGRRRARSSVRRVYSATIDSRNSNVTVAMYHGDGAEEDWWRDREMYVSVRHPNVVQICGGASYGNIHASVFHGDLVPLEVFLARQSPLIRVYLYGCYSEEWRRVDSYFESLQRTLYPSECTMWIRASTGRLSVDPVPPDTHTEPVWHPSLGYRMTSPVTAVETSLRQEPAPSSPANAEGLVMESLALKQYHRICFLYLTQYRDGSISTSATVNIGAVISWPARCRYEQHVEIASLGKLYVEYSRWLAGHGVGDLAGNGWSRYRAEDIFNTDIMLRVYFYDPEAWFSQANHVFSCLQITSNLEDYVLADEVWFKIIIPSSTASHPPGFLFICPKEDFRVKPTSFRWPKCPAYWSLDSSGLDPLGTEEAARLGFPPFQLTTDVRGSSWDASVYTDLRKFHQAKRFDPASQDIALHLGEPLYRLSQDVNSHAEETSAEGEADAIINEGRTDSRHNLGSGDAPTGIPDRESPTVSWGFRFIMAVQLMLMFFNSLFSLYEQVI